MRHAVPVRLVAFLAVTLGPAVAPNASAQGAGTPTAGAEPATLFTDVRIFDGKSGTLSGPAHVLVRGKVIAKISTTSIPDAGAGATVISGAGRRVLMPGLIDAHWHAMLVRPSVVEMATGDFGYLYLLAGAEATSTLMRG